MSDICKQLNGDLSDEAATTLTSGYFLSPIHFKKRGKTAIVRADSKAGWSFAAATATKIADFPVGYAPKFDSRDVLYRGAVPIGYVETRTTGLYITSSAASDESFWKFDIMYWLP